MENNSKISYDIFIDDYCISVNETLEKATERFTNYKALKENEKLELHKNTLDMDGSIIDSEIISTRTLEKAED